MTTYTQRNNWNWLAWLLVLISAIMFIIALTSCTKPPDTLVDCDCGITTEKWTIPADKHGREWTYIVWQDSCSGDLDTITMPFDMSDWRVGDVVCELKEIETLNN